MPTGIEGLIHNTTLIEHQGKKADEVVKVGQKEQFRVLSVSKKDRKLGLSMKLEFDKNAPGATQQKQAPRKEKKAETAPQQQPQQQQHQAQQSNAPKA